MSSPKQHPDPARPDDHELAAAAALAGLQPHQRLAALPGNWFPSDIASAYRVQRLARQLTGLAPAGYKVGMTNAAVQQAHGLAEPIVGWLPAAAVLASGSTIPGAARRGRWVESEVVFRMAADLPRQREPYARETVSRAVAAAYAGLEICDSRFVDVDAQPMPSVIADNSNASLVVLGAELPSLDGPMQVTLACGSSGPVVGSTRAVLGDPLRSLCWLANWLNDHGEALRAGQYVASGTCTGVTQAGPDDHCVARFGAGASVECHFLP